MEIRCFDLLELDHEAMKYVVLLATYKRQFVIIRNKARSVWELPGGKREAGETMLAAAGRELHEETGALSYTLTPYGVYEMSGTYGMNFYVEIEELGELPDYEIAEIKLVDELPRDLKHDEIFYLMNEQWQAIQDKTALKSYRLRRGDVHEQL